MSDSDSDSDSDSKSFFASYSPKGGIGLVAIKVMISRRITN